jgi:type IV pilus assembly protein PilB
MQSHSNRAFQPGVKDQAGAHGIYFDILHATGSAMSTTHTHQIAEILLLRKAITPEQLAAAQADCGDVPIEKYLAQNAMVSLEAVALAIADYLRLAPIALGHFTPDQALLDLLEPEVWLRYKAVPVSKCHQTLVVALADPFDLQIIDDLHALSGLSITPLVAVEKEIVDQLGRNAAATSQNLDLAEVMQVDGVSDVEIGREEKDESLEQTIESAEGAPVIRMVNMMLVEALRTRASDIHIEPQERTTRLRYRIDGNLIERPAPPKTYHNAVISRVKILADLDISERRIPQDGRFKIRALGREVDIRVSILPTVHGEKVVMRTLDKTNLAPGLAQLGLDDFAYKAMSYAIEQPNGIILVTGPTGSGKTTTLYSCLQDLNKSDVNVVTAEDPVEYQLPGVNQVHVNTAVGLTFSSVLRSVLRQDPDIVLVGEIRDNETADIAVKAALTGHLVLSTLHTNSAAGVIARLADMKVPPFLLASSLILAQAQRLFRKLCPVCRREMIPDPVVLERNHIRPDFFEGGVIYGPTGCPKCNNTGYKSRGAVMEVLSVNAEIRDAIARNLPSSVIQELAVKSGMITLKDAGLLKVRAGVTSLTASIEVTGGD